MRHKGLILLLGTIGTIFAVTYCHRQASLTYSQTLTTPFAPHRPRILIVNTELGFGGAEVHCIHQYKALCELGYEPILLVAKNGQFAQELTERNIPFYATHCGKVFGIMFRWSFYQNLYTLCQKQNINIIHCNSLQELPASTNVTRQLAIPLVITLHLNKKVKPETIKGINGIICINKSKTNEIRELCKEYNLEIESLSTIPPFFDEQRFLSFKTDVSKEDFLIRYFNPSLCHLPVICCVGCLHQNKNQKLLLKALHILCHQKKRSFLTLFAGEGKMLKALKNLATNLKIDHLVHFLGYTNDIPLLLHHSDINILPSKNETCGISLIEAALMKRSLIGAANTGATSIIKHQKTGILIDPDDPHDLANAIEQLIDQKELYTKLACSAFRHIQKKFSTKISMKKLGTFYEKLGIKPSAAIN